MIAWEMDMHVAEFEYRPGVEVVVEGRVERPENLGLEEWFGHYRGGGGSRISNSCR